jgi:hypothetical protein
MRVVKLNKNRESKMREVEKKRKKEKKKNMWIRVR